MAPQTQSLVFKVRRNPQELVTPAKPTPKEFKLLSDIDDQTSLRSLTPLVTIYRNNPSMEGKDPVEIIREALSKTLVFYYPFAGRLRNGPNGKLMVDCTGEGVIFIEADADVTLDQFGIDLHPPFPCFDQLLYDVPGSDGILDSPLLLIQVTRLKCGGFIFAVRLNHAMCDAIGMSQFMKGLAEIARGEPKPFILPVWHRELLCARNPPKVTFIHNEYQKPPHDNNNNNFILQHSSFFFGPNELDAIRRLLPYHHSKSTTSDILTAFLWRCRTLALQPENPNHEFRLLYILNARYGRCSFNPPLPEGFYGNAFVSPAAISTGEKLCNNPLEYALELMKEAKSKGTEEYVHSVADLMVIKGRPSYFYNDVGYLEVSDLTKARFRDVDFGWGKAVYGGATQGYFSSILYVSYTNSKGVEGIMALTSLPTKAMERFEKELDDLFKTKDKSQILRSHI
uniref:13-hydroxylupanine O-tigloyltransferase n=2 Tax=Lupinus albus TaxID=3870 RepID=HLTT_LUPAL|nr:RecName: Full=13-hydroxylupanine O-tigloyltransferase; AltName: Full=(-)-13alpha-hydroxymultiflorine/(+)-13alpha-hydroxylupanine O-tigloyltransferase; Short=HMT/HLTase; AltName: Full=Quinolizidine alkaloid O-tigloyltransferase [Lupinus albus]BAD89275.1 (-)-13alpha-hydroxymultiflorine/(+)-13alpha- hydroxylupanine O-tigloyltransferase [Lupinus albus]